MAEEPLPKEPSLFHPRVWTVVSTEKAVVQMDMRAMRVDAKFAAGLLLKAVQKKEVLHFDEALAQARELKDLEVVKLVIRDETSGKELSIELTNVPDNGTAFVDGLNKFEELLAQLALQMAQQE